MTSLELFKERLPQYVRKTLNSSDEVLCCFETLCSIIDIQSERIDRLEQALLAKEEVSDE